MIYEGTYQLQSNWHLRTFLGSIQRQYCHPQISRYIIAWEWILLWIPTPQLILCVLEFRLLRNWYAFQLSPTPPVSLLNWDVPIAPPDTYGRPHWGHTSPSDECKCLGTYHSTPPWPEGHDSATERDTGIIPTHPHSHPAVITKLMVHNSSVSDQNITRHTVSLATKRVHYIPLMTELHFQSGKWPGQQSSPSLGAHLTWHRVVCALNDCSCALLINCRLLRRAV